MKADQEVEAVPVDIWNRFVGFGARHKYTDMTWLTSISVTAGYFLLMLLMLILPLKAFVYIMTNNQFSTIKNDVVTLNPCGGPALVGLIGFTFILSLITGGFGRIFLKSRFVYPWVIILAGLGLLWGLTVTLDGFKKIAGTIAAIDKGDNAKAAAFMTFWALMIGYAGKAIWDELRDRVADLIESAIPSKKADSTFSVNTVDNKSGNRGVSAMASDDQKTILDEANTDAVRTMISKLGEHDVVKVYEAVGQVGPIADLAAEAMQERNIDL